MVLKVADQVRTQFESRIFEISKEYIKKSGNRFPKAGNIGIIRSYFESGVPTDGPYSIGEMLCAAWDLFLSPLHDDDSGSRSKITYISDLVLKSVEAQQFSERMRNAKRR